jgi:hypothetical protein
MPILLISSLAVVYVLGIAGVVFVGSNIGGPARDRSRRAPLESTTPRSLDERLALVRTTAATNQHLLPGAHVATRSRRLANATRARRRVVESIVRAFTPVLDQRTRSDVAASGPVRPD